MINWIVEHALPLATAAVIAELMFILRYRKQLFDAREQITSIGCVALTYMMDYLLNGGLVFRYVMTQLMAGIASGTTHSLGSWLICLAAVDLQAYLWHRASHAFSPLWALHHVHHQSRQMSFVAALRQPAMGFFLPWLQLLPLALLGFSVEVALSCLMIHRLWDFLLHMHFDPRLGPFESIFMTPAHHRIHHAIERPYYHSNMGTILTVWDRIGGTHLCPRQVTALRTIELGTEGPVSELNPISANLRPLMRLFQP